MSEQELRDRLRAEVAAVEAPGDLAVRAEQGWRRRRRNQIVVAGAAVAVLAVVGGAVVALPRQGPAPVAAPAADGCAELPAPPAVRAARTMAGWDYRGDPALKAKTLALVPPELRATARPLLGLRTITEMSPNAWVYALALRQSSGWHVRIGMAEELNGKVLPIDDVLLPLPRDGAVSAFVAQRWDLPTGQGGGSLVVLGAPGTERIDYAGCKDGRTFTTGRDGDYLVLTTGTLEEPGRLTAEAGGRTVALGRPQDISRLPLAPPGTPDVGGYRGKWGRGTFQLVGPGATERFNVGNFYQAPRPTPVVVLGVCAGRGSVRVEGTALPCDRRTHRVWSGTRTSASDTIEAVGVPDPATGRTSVSVALTVIGG